MNNFFTFFNAILLLGTFQGFVLVILILLRRKGNITAHKILAGIIFFLSFSMFLHTISDLHIIPYLEYHALIISLFTLLVAPLIYLYTKALTVYQFRLSRNDLINGIPFVSGCIISVILFFVITTASYVKILHAVLFLLDCLVTIPYLWFAHREIQIYHKIISENYSTLEKRQLNWLKTFIIALTIFWMFVLANEISLKAFSMDYAWLVNCVIIYLIGYYGFLQPEIFSSPILDPFNKQNNSQQKYEKSSLTDEIANSYIHKLKTRMMDEKLYLEKDISLASLSQDLGITLHHLSQIINGRLGLNFYDYINKQRIEEARKILLDPSYDNQNIASIAFEVGFNSLSAFNSAFKKFSNQTPSQFRSRKTA